MRIPQTPPSITPRRVPELVIVPAAVPRCAVCGTQLQAGTEAARWLGASLAHVGCVDPVAGPHGS